MEILKSLGVDSTLWILLACFVVSYFALSLLIFKPYMRAFHEREKRTIGNEESAVRLIQESQELEQQYETKARAINTRIKSIFDDARTGAVKEHEGLVRSARTEAAHLLDEARQKIATEVSKTRKQISAEVPAVGQAIASKLAGKDLSV